MDVDLEVLNYIKFFCVILFIFFSIICRYDSA